MATNYGQDWDIKSPGKKCAATERVFDDGEEVMSRLIYTAEGYQREDCSMNSWTDELQKTALSYWKSVYRAPVEKEPEPFGLDDAEGLLRRLMEEDRENNIHTIFVLAAMLERKRLLVEKEVQHPVEGQQVRVYEHKKSGDTFIIVDPALHLDQLESVQLDIAVALGWKPPLTAEEEGMAQAEVIAEELAKTAEAGETLVERAENNPAS